MKDEGNERRVSVRANKEMTLPLKASEHLAPPGARVTRHAYGPLVYFLLLL